MITFENFNNIDKKEKLFLELANLDDLNMKFDFIDLPNEFFYFYKDICFFVQDKKGTCFSINDDEIWSIYRNKISMSYHSTQSFMRKMIEKYFNLYDYDIVYIHIYTINIYNDVFFD